MTWICYRGIELSARIQQLLLGVRGRDARRSSPSSRSIKVYSGNAAAATRSSRRLDWFNPFAMNFGDLVSAMLLGVLHLLGLGLGVAVNEESEDPDEGPGQAAVVSTILLVLIYLVVSAGAQAYHGSASSPTKKTPATC